MTKLIIIPHLAVFLVRRGPPREYIVARIDGDAITADRVKAGAGPAAARKWARDRGFTNYNVINHHGLHRLSEVTLTLADIKERRR